MTKNNPLDNLIIPKLNHEGIVLFENVVMFDLKGHCILKAR